MLGVKPKENTKKNIKKKKKRRENSLTGDLAPALIIYRSVLSIFICLIDSNICIPNFS